MLYICVMTRNTVMFQIILYSVLLILLYIATPKANFTYSCLGNETDLRYKYYISAYNIAKYYKMSMT
jgi:hypothetical protein